VEAEDVAKSRASVCEKSDHNLNQAEPNTMLLLNFKNRKSLSEDWACINGNIYMLDLGLVFGRFVSVNDFKMIP